MIGTTVFCFTLSGCKGKPDQNYSETEDKVQGFFQSIHGQTGRVSFGITFLSRPRIHLSPLDDSSTAEAAAKKTVIIEPTTTGFKWKNTGQSPQDDGMLKWEARGDVKKS
jgi:hypothetical protein